MPKHDDFQFLAIVRPKAQRRKLKHPAKNNVAEREEHEASRSDVVPFYATAFSGLMHPSAGMMYTCVSNLAACCADSRRYEPLLTRFSLTS